MGDERQKQEKNCFQEDEKKKKTKKSKKELAK